jgi:mannose-1-phosphate guanylyltransferase
MPKLYEGLWRIYDSIDTNDIDEVILKEYMDFESISIDYGIMEKAKDIRIFKGIFGWDDVGSWLAVSRMKELDEYNNAISGNVVLHKTSNCIIESRDKLIATVGINDTVIIDTKDAILISDKSSLSDIKEVLKILKERKGDKYL